MTPPPLGETPLGGLGKAGGVPPWEAGFRPPWEEFRLLLSRHNNIGVVYNESAMKFHYGFIMTCCWSYFGFFKPPLSGEIGYHVMDVWAYVQPFPGPPGPFSRVRSCRSCLGPVGTCYGPVRGSFFPGRSRKLGPGGDLYHSCVFRDLGVRSCSGPGTCYGPISDIMDLSRVTFSLEVPGPSEHV
jgi:hypothetical protein